MSHRARFILSTLAILTTAGTGAAFAAPRPPGELRSPRDVVLFEGVAGQESALTGALPELCPTTKCDRFDVFVDLPAGVWSKRGGVQFAIRWFNFEDALDLRVYRDGKLIAASEGPLVEGQSVLVPKAPNGLYSMYIVYEEGSSSLDVPYEGLAEVEYEPNVEPVRQLRPDFTMRPQEDLKFATGALLFSPGAGELASCYPEETVTTGATVCLRFDQTIANVGEGPFEIRFAIPRNPLDSSRHAFQRIFWSDGRSEDRVAGEWEFHATHGHFHYRNFALSRLWESDGSGRRLGDAPLRTGRKVSFCMIDVRIDAWARKGDAPRTYTGPTCLIPTEHDIDFDYILNGVSAGWSDVYDWYLSDQYLNVSGLPDGYYILESVADPDGKILEADETNNCGAVWIRLLDMATTAPHAEVLGPGPACR